MLIFLASLTRKKWNFPFYISKLGYFSKAELPRKTRMRMNKLL
jgi:hypothetical protein